MQPSERPRGSHLIKRAAASVAPVSASGTFYEMTTTGSLTWLHSFCLQTGCADGSNPQALILGTDGNFYGTTKFGGTHLHALRGGQEGYPCWHMYGDLVPAGKPAWKELLSQYNEVTEDGAIKLTMNGSVCLGQVHSIRYRDQIEAIYLSALDVSTERFRFDVQFFGDSATVFTHAG